MTTVKLHKLYIASHRTNENGVVERKCSKCQEWKEEKNNFYMMNKSKPEKGFHSKCKKM